MISSSSSGACNFWWDVDCYFRTWACVFCSNTYYPSFGIGISSLLRMNFVLHPCPSIPDPLRHLVADENRTIFIRANGSVNSERTWSGHVKTVGKGSGEFAEIRSVDAVSFQQFVDMHNKLMSREVTSTEWHEEAAFASPCLLTNIRQHPVACPNGIACIVDVSEQHLSIAYKQFCIFYIVL